MGLTVEYMLGVVAKFVVAVFSTVEYIIGARVVEDIKCAVIIGLVVAIFFVTDVCE